MNGEPETITINGMEVKLTPDGVSTYIWQMIEVAMQGLHDAGIEMNYLLTLYPVGNPSAVFVIGNDGDVAQVRFALIQTNSIIATGTPEEINIGGLGSPPQGNA